MISTKLLRRPRSRVVVCSIRKTLFHTSVVAWIYLVVMWSTIASISEKNDQRNFLGIANQYLQRGALSIPGNSSLTIGIASTITACGNDGYTEGAAVLKYSIDQTSIHGPKGGKYNYKMYILHHPDARECSWPLRELGFELLECPTPVNISDIRGEVVRERIENNGCCGARELIKLEVFRLSKHPIVIHMDLDTIVLKPMDPAIDLMLNPDQGIQDSQKGRHFIMWPGQPIPPQIDLMFTKDYNLVGPWRKDKPYQGGFFMIKPSLKVYQEFLQIVLEGDYRNNSKLRKGTGWRGMVGPFHGGMTIQGLLPLYFEYLHPGRAVELNRCVYNNMADNPTTEEAINDVAQGRCRTNEETCEDCRNRNISDITTFHFTVCSKPWGCFPHAQDAIEHRLCRKAHHEWFKHRHRMELSWGRNGTGPKAFRAEHFFGNCEFAFKGGYYPIRTPYGQPETG